jgi:mannose-1-phosphate guanylyltransferase/phosphomannomutase
MVPILNRPILEHILLLLKAHGIHDIIILLYYLPEMIKHHFGDGAEFGVKLRFITAKEDLGTAGAVRQAMEMIDDSFLVLSGDALTNLDLTGMVAYHREKKSLATIGLSRVWNPSPFGVAVTDDHGKITRFLEKPVWSQVFSDTVNMGIYVLEPEIFQLIPEGREYFFAKDLYPLLIKRNMPLYGFTNEAYWKDIGDPKTYQEVHFHALAEKLSLKLDGSFKQGAWQGENCRIGKNVKFDGIVVLGRACEIADNTHLSNVVMGSGCRIEEFGFLKDTILWINVQVGKGSVLSMDVIGSQSKIGAGTVIEEHVYIAEECVVGDQCHVQHDIKIWPHKQIDSGSYVSASLVWGDRWNRELFVESRISGIANYDVTPEFATKLGVAYGTWLGRNHSVLLSRDATPAARMVYRAVITGLLSAGTNVSSIQAMPLPIVNYALRSSKELAGVHVRRSPEEEKSVEILFFDQDGRSLTPAATKGIERIFFREDFPRAGIDEVGSIEYPVRITESYRKDCLSQLDIPAIDAKKYRIVIDYSHGAATQVFPSILGAFDCEVISLNSNLDPRRLLKDENEKRTSLKRLGKIVKSTGSHIGFMLDSSGQFVQCVDENGEVLTSERLAVLISYLFIQLHKPAKIAVPVSIPQQVEEFAGTAGADIVYTHANTGAIISSTSDEAVEYAVGVRGGFIFTAFHFAFDGMFALLKILELLSKANTSLSQLDKELPRRVCLKDSVTCPWELKGSIMRRLMEYSRDVHSLFVDGVKLFYGDAWALILPDSDKPAFRIITEASEAKTAEELLERFQKQIGKWLRAK